ncbi:MAG: M12 family metallo-peptidase [Saprospiraceae bacterium]|nr:M12 family metallo-peptidase [Saprospiraceae bacterium]
MKKVLTTLALLMPCLLAFAQLNNPWLDVPETQFAREDAVRRLVPDKYRTLGLDLDLLKGILEEAPMRFTPKAVSNPAALVIPMPDGTMQEFQVVEAPVMHPDLAAKYPEMRSFAGWSKSDGTAYLRCGYTQRGFHAQVFSAHHSTAYIDLYFDNPFEAADDRHYISYFKKDYTNPHDFECLVESPHAADQTETPTPQSEISNPKSVGDCQHRNYSLALACTGEYAAFHGGTVPLVLAAYNLAITRINGIYEREMAVSLTLVANTDQLIFLDAATDPYANNDGGTMLGQNQMTCDNVIGNGNYDMGHVFSTGGGGIASLNSVCSPSSKAQGVTGQASPIGDPFVVDYVAHEMGHQFGGNHTQSNNCNRSDATAMEPGSASTIMGYAGICAPDVQNNSDDYFHTINLDEMHAHLLGGGNSCPTKTPSGNNAPTVSAPVTNYKVPISTPFVLTAVGSDPDPSDVITYCWEQMDNQSATMPPLPTNNGGPAFRSFDPSTSPKRYFPNLPAVVANATPTWEVLPAVGRSMDFRCTVRDNHPGAGCIASDANVSLDFVASAGPFLVQYPNDASVNLNAGQQVTVTWDVANTHLDPVGCKYVNLNLSVDGGFNYPYSLVVSTPNDGSETVFLPDVTTTTARVQVEAADNVFYDISNENFTISAAQAPGYTLALSPQSQRVCVPDIASLEIQTGALLGFDVPIQFDITAGLPAGVVVNFVNNPATPGQLTTLSLDLSSVTADGDYEIVLRAIAGEDTVFTNLYFNLIYSDFSALQEIAPANGQSGLGLQPIFTWTDLPQVDFYDFELATSPDFEPSTIINSKQNLTEATFTPTIALVESTIYYWRVRPSNDCGESDYFTPRSFQTFTVQCSPFESQDVPKNISGIGTPTIESIMPILQNGTISDVNVSQIKGNHDVLNDLRISLVSPAGTVVKLFENICGNVTTFNFGLNDESPFTIACPPINGSSYQPQSLLSAFNGENTVGEWKLRVEVIDPAGQGGTLEKWALEFCASTTPNSPFMVNNDTIYLKPLNSRTIFNSDLAVEDPDNPSSELQFTIVDETEFGYLSRSGVQLGIGDQFTMEDIHFQRIAYNNTDGDATYDFFSFIVEDGTGGWLGTPIMHIVIDENAVVSANETVQHNEIKLSPNPASSLLNVSFLQPLTGSSLARVVDVHGRLVASQKVQQGIGQFQLDLRPFTNGVYFLTILTPEGVLAKKFVVEK